MLSQEDADACIEAAAADLKSLSYEELERLARLHGSSDEWQSRELQTAGETVYVNTTFAKFGRFRKRVSVEMVLSAEGGCDWPRVPCVYFERFKSGQLFVARAPGELVRTLFHALPYAFVSGVVIALAVLVWHLFLRAR